MINTEEFRNLIRDIVREELGERSRFKIGTIASSVGKPAVIFAGENEPSEKQYSFLGSYTPYEGDRVLLARMGSTYVVLGKIDQGQEPMFGSNQNGNWIRHPDGTQICWAEIEVTEPVNISSNGLYRSDTMIWNFPQSFVGDGGFAWFESTSLNRWAQKTTNPHNTSASFRLWRANSSSVLGTVNGFAIGKWKE